jgi:hypothetical protein
MIAEISARGSVSSGSGSTTEGMVRNTSSSNTGPSFDDPAFPGPGPGEVGDIGSGVVETLSLPCLLLLGVPSPASPAGPASVEDSNPLSYLVAVDAVVEPEPFLLNDDGLSLPAGCKGMGWEPEVIEAVRGGIMIGRVRLSGVGRDGGGKIGGREGISGFGAALEGVATSELSEPSIFALFLLLTVFSFSSLSEVLASPRFVPR